MENKKTTQNIILIFLISIILFIVKCKKESTPERSPTPAIPALRISGSPASSVTFVHPGGIEHSVKFEPGRITGY